MFRLHPQIVYSLVLKCAWSAKSPVLQVCLRQRFKLVVKISLLSLLTRGIYMCVCVCVGRERRERELPQGRSPSGHLSVAPVKIRQSDVS